MAAVGFAAAVADAHPLVLSAAHWVSTAPGGRGAVRELCDALLRARAPAAGQLMVFRIFTLLAVIALGGQHLDIELARPPPTSSGRERRTGGICRAITSRTPC